MVPYLSGRVEISIDEPQFRWIREHGTLHIPDVRAQNDFPTLGSVERLAHLLSRSPSSAGGTHWVTGARRTEVRPFTPAQIKLLETFADQAVIAIENVRLFQELKESLEQQTATSEILGVIASSPTDIQPVLDVVAENAARLCEATNAQILRFDGECLATRCQLRNVPSSTEAPIRRGSPLGANYVVERKTDPYSRPSTPSSKPSSRMRQHLGNDWPFGLFSAPRYYEKAFRLV